MEQKKIQKLITVSYIIIYNSLSFGAFGWVFIDINSSIGQSLVVKKLRIRRADYIIKLA